MAVPQALFEVAARWWDKVHAAAEVPPSPGIEISSGSAARARDHQKLKRSVLGCGSWGCVWPTGDPRWVVKFTNDPTEGGNIAGILNAEGYPKAYEGLALIKGVWTVPETLPWRGKQRQVFAVVREDVRPLDTKVLAFADARARSLRRAAGTGAIEPDEAYNLRTLLEGSKLLTDYLHAGRGVRQVGPDHAYRVVRIRKDERHEFMSQAAGEMTGNPVVYRIGESLLNLMGDGIVLKDVHLGNVGYRVHAWPELYWEPSDTALVIFDFGHVSSVRMSPVRLS